MQVGVVVFGSMLVLGLYESALWFEILVFCIRELGFSNIFLGAVNFIVTARYKCGPEIRNVGVGVFYLVYFATAILWIITVPVLASAVTFILTDKLYNTCLYGSSTVGGDLVFFQYLFFCFLGILRFILYYCGDYELAVCELVVLVVVGVSVCFQVNLLLWCSELYCWRYGVFFRWVYCCDSIGIEVVRCVFFRWICYCGTVSYVVVSWWCAS